MNTYKRQIKFCYYKVAWVEYSSDGEEQVKGKFNLVEWLMNMLDNGEINHNITLDDCIVNLEQYYICRPDNIYAIRVFKLRDANIPSKIKDGAESTPIPLEPDEYIGEDLNLLYDRDNSICMIQQNRMSLGISRLVEWVNRICHIENGKVVFIPLADRFTSERLGKRNVRTIDFSFANLEPDDKDGSLGRIIAGMGKFNGMTGHISISAGRSKNAKLDQGNVIDLINELQSNPGIVNGAKIKITDDSRDDDKSHVEIVDLFENTIHDYIQFEIEVKKPLDFVQARAKMYETYLKRKDWINTLCQW